jgi:CheY-like chemotaxis protein
MVPQVKRILLVEDEQDIVILIKYWLEDAGYEVITTDNGDDVLQFARNAQPDMILLDLHIPGISGYSLCPLLKADEKTKKIPVIILTASVDNIEAKKRKIAADDYITKPFDERNLIEKAAKYTQKVDSNT